ncbi:MAG: hypothetical protein U0174_13735 [Polyangiaceae bacterium]
MPAFSAERMYTYGRSLRSHVAATTLAVTCAAAIFSCGGEAAGPNKNLLADKWLKRANDGYRTADMDDAKLAVDEALKINPASESARLLRGRIALAKLDFADALKATEGMQSTEAHMIRGRAHWYAGDIERAADELDAMLRDPNVKDPWAKDVAQLARRGNGRKPFAMEGGVVAVTEMPQAGSLLVVQCELEGENILALVATGVAELTVDSASRREPAWVNLRFADRIEVKDVPAITQDLSGLSKQLGAPIKALLGVNLLRHMHVTFDRRAAQFVVRREDPPAPPDATRVPLYYVRGGGMLVRAGFSKKSDALASLFIDTSTPYPMALSDETWGLAGIPLTSLRGDPGLPPNYRAGIVPLVRVGSFDVPQVPAVQGAEMDDIKKRVDVDFGGILGAGFLMPFRVTFGDEGRFAWFETGPDTLVAPPGDKEPPQATPPVQTPPPAATLPALAPSAPPKAGVKKGLKP